MLGDVDLLPTDWVSRSSKRVTRRATAIYANMNKDNGGAVEEGVMFREPMKVTKLLKRMVD